MHDLSRLSTAMRTTDTRDTAEFLKHRNALRRTIVRVVFELDGGTWSLEDDHIVDQCERWLIDRIHPLHRPNTEEVA